MGDIMRVIVTKTEDERVDIEKSLPDTYGIMYTVHTLKSFSVRGIGFSALYFVMDRNDVPDELLESIAPILLSSRIQVIYGRKFYINCFDLDW